MGLWWWTRGLGRGFGLGGGGGGDPLAGVSRVWVGSAEMAPFWREGPAMVGFDEVRWALFWVE